jgi:hypothetical protein
MPLKIRSNVTKSTVKSTTSKKKTERNPDQIYKSMYKVVLNTNKKLKIADRKKLEAEIVDTWEKVFLNHLDEIVTFDPEVANKEEAIKDFSTDWRFEVGDRFKRLHAHSSMIIMHNNMIKLDYGLIRQLFLEELPGDSEIKESIWLLIKHESDQEYAWQVYTSKQEESEV